MTRRFFSLLCCIGLAIAGGPVLAAAYSIVQLTDNDVYDFHPVINSVGQVAWSGGGEIFLYDGSQVVQLTDNDYPDDGDVSINDCGQVAWSGGPDDDKEIYLYDGSRVIQITDDPPGPVVARDRSPDINIHGHVVWVKFGAIMFYDGRTISTIASPIFGGPVPDLNDSGQIVWLGDADGRDNVLYYDSAGLQQLTYGDKDRYPNINESGTVVWTRETFQSEEVMMWNGTDVTQITGNDVIDIGARVNDADQIAWMRGFGTDREIYGYSDSQEIRVTYNNLEEIGFYFNSSPVVVYQARVGSAWELFVWDGTERQLTNTGATNWAPQISDNDQIAWHAWGGSIGEDYEVFLATPDDLVIGDPPLCDSPDEDSDEDDDEVRDDGSFDRFERDGQIPDSGWERKRALGR